MSLFARSLVLLISSLILVSAFGLSLPLPTLCLHGRDGSYKDCEPLIKYAKKRGIKVLALDFNNDMDSNKCLQLQVDELVQKLKKINSSPGFQAGYNIVAVGQSALIARCAIEEMSDHKVNTFISCGGAQAGYYGVNNLPDYVYGDLDDSSADKVCNYKTQQRLSGPANLWRTKRYNDYLEMNPFLVKYNNELARNFNPKYVANFLRLQKFVMLGSPEDTKLRPWYSSLGDFDDAKGNRQSIILQRFWSLGMPFIPKNAIEMYFEPPFLTIESTAAQMVQTSHSHQVNPMKTPREKMKKDLKVLDTEISLTEGPLDIPLLPMKLSIPLGLVPPLNIPPMPPALASFKNKLPEHDSQSLANLLKSPFSPPMAPSAFFPGHYRGFGLYELSRQEKVYRFEVKNITTNPEWLSKPNAMGIIVTELMPSPF